MEAEDVMISDWVYVTSICGWECDPIAQHVRAIEYHSYRGSDYCDWVSMDCDDEVSLTNIEPIPLTQEILEKNGWMYDDLCGEYRHANAFVICGRGPFTIFDGIRISYVHELQHALRLAGFKKLANEFQMCD